MGLSSQVNGDACESRIADELKNFKSSTRAQMWLQQLGYPHEIVESVEVHDTSKTKGTCTEKGRNGKVYYLYPVKFSKTDRKIIVTVGSNGRTYNELISVKSCKHESGKGCSAQHIARSSLDTYLHQWKNYPDWSNDVAIGLELLIGRDAAYLMPAANKFLREPVICQKKLNDYASEDYSDRLVKLIDVASKYVSATLTFLNRNRVAIIMDGLKGRGGLAAEWLLLISGSCEDEAKQATAKLININDAINKLANSFFTATKTSYATDGITIKRYGGSSITPKKKASLIANCQEAYDEYKFMQGSQLQIQLKLSELFAGDVPIVEWPKISED